MSPQCEVLHMTGEGAGVASSTSSASSPPFAPGGYRDAQMTAVSPSSSPRPRKKIVKKKKNATVPDGSGDAPSSPPPPALPVNELPPQHQQQAVVSPTLSSPGGAARKLKKKKRTSVTIDSDASPNTSFASLPHDNMSAVSPAFMMSPPVGSTGGSPNYPKLSGHNNNSNDADMFAGMHLSPSGSPDSVAASSPFPTFLPRCSSYSAPNDSICSLGEAESERSCSPPSSSAKTRTSQKKAAAKGRRKSHGDVLSSPPTPVRTADVDASSGCLDKFEEKLTQRGILQGLWRSKGGSRIEVAGADVLFTKTGRKIQLKELLGGSVELMGVRMKMAARDGSEVVWCDGDVWTRQRDNEGTYQPVTLEMLSREA